MLPFLGGAIILLEKSSITTWKGWFEKKSAALTLFTGYDYMRKGIDHAMSEDSKD